MLPVTFRHLEVFKRLDVFHKDPFDRMIISQGISEDVGVISYDRVFGNYPVRVI